MEGLTKRPRLEGDGGHDGDSASSRGLASRFKDMS